ncbi:MAG: enoyl-CoA hydratase/isomerase family protein [Acidimicrobiales bacterium]|nr:enoyl-CoA hydratase/isomerase family protein [Acidimicrobiales bacterium]
MTVVRWSRAEVGEGIPAAAVDDLDDVDVLVLDGVTAADPLAWCVDAPCVVVAGSPPDAPPPATVDVVIDAGDSGRLDQIVRAVEASPTGARLLVDVLRTSRTLDVRRALSVESLAYSTLLASPPFRSWLEARAERVSPSFDEPPVRMVRAADVLRVTLARPENRNAFSAVMRDALVEALLVADADISVHVVVDAEGPVFSSGGDLTEFGTASDVARAHQIRTHRSVGVLLDRLGPRATIHVKGDCVGAGVELPAFAHRVVAAPDTTFRLPEVAMGLIPGAGGTVSLPRRIGRQATAELALTGRTMDVDEALDLGLVDELET